MVFFISGILFFISGLRLEAILVDFGRRADFRPGRFLPDARKLANVGQISYVAHLLPGALENLPNR